MLNIIQVKKMVKLSENMNNCLELHIVKVCITMRNENDVKQENMKWWVVHSLEEAEKKKGQDIQ